MKTVFDDYQVTKFDVIIIFQVFFINVYSGNYSFYTALLDIN